MGQKAVVPYHDGHFYVGQDNIYFLSTRGRQAIGTPVVEETIRQCSNLWRVYAVADPKRNRVCFGFPVSSEYIEKVWSFDYRTQAWSYEEYPTWMIANPLFSGSLSWDDLTGTWDALSATYPTWDDMRAETDDDRDFIREFEGALQEASEGATVDDVAGPVEVVLQSKNYDLGEPDLQKVWTRLALKIQFRREMVAFDIPLVFDVEVSYNAGRNWKGVGQLRIAAGADEGYCNFRLSSSHFMFRLTSASQVTPYWITEYTYTFAIVGEERRLGLQGV